MISFGLSTFAFRVWSGIHPFVVSRGFTVHGGLWVLVEIPFLVPFFLCIQHCTTYHILLRLCLINVDKIACKVMADEPLVNMNAFWIVRGDTYRQSRRRIQGAKELPLTSTLSTLCLLLRYFGCPRSLGSGSLRE